MDLYTCLAGELLVPRTRNVARSLIGYQVKAGTCDACSPRSQCTTSKLGRQILRHFDEEYVDRVKGYRGTFLYEKVRLCASGGYGSSVRSPRPRIGTG
jgi:hypothetical protein